MPQKNQKPTEETQTKITGAVGAFYDVQLALQKNALDAARTTLESAIEFQRKSLTTFARVIEQNLKVPAMDATAFSTSLQGFVKGFPGMTPETTQRIVDEVTTVAREMQSAAAQSGDVVREAATRGVEQYTALLGNVESRSRQGLDSVGTNAEAATKVARRMTDAWVDAVFNALQVATKATEDATAVVAESAEVATKAAEDASGVAVKIVEESTKAAAPSK